LIAFSCQKNDEKQLQNNKVDYDKIGIMHNQGLDYAFKTLKAAKEKGCLSKSTNEDYIDQLYKSTISYIDVNFSDLTDKEIQEVKNSLLKTKETIIELSSSSSKGNEYLYQSIMKKAESLMTDKQKEISNKILSIMSENSDIDRIFSKMALVENEINQTCSEEEKPCLLAMLSVAKHSSEYWNQNLSNWITEFGTSKDTPKLSWALVGESDAAYALYAGITCSTAVIVPFIGWGAYIGIVGGGTLITSGTAALLQII